MAKKILFTIIALTLVLFAGCNLSSTNNNNNSENKVGLANPASVYCTEQGGKLEMRENDKGQYGVCIFETFECEEWAYFRGECPVEKKSELGNFCGGIGAIECKENLKCQLDGDFPDAGGRCVEMNKIITFEECVAAGNPTTKSIPAQCNADNTTFYEKIERYQQEKICTMEYAPVCGEDGRSYSNKCMAGNITISHEGEC